MSLVRIAGAFGTNPLFALMCLGAAPLLWTVERRITFWGVALLAAMAVHVLADLPTAPYFASNTLAFLGQFGAICAVLLAASALYRREARLPAVIFGLVVIEQWCTGVFLRHTGTAIPYTFDRLIASVEGGIGVQPSFAVGRLFAAVPAVMNASFLAYNGLLFGLLLLCAFCGGRSAVDLLLRFAAAGVTGGALYFLLPVCGPVYGFPEMFPHIEPAFDAIAAAPSLLPPSPRNGIPSLHLTWALLFYFRARTGPAWLRAVFAFLLLGTATATVGLGEHYLIDLVIAVPFACAVTSAGSRGVSWRAVAGYLLTTLAWMCVLRFRPEWLASGPVLLTAEFVTVVVSLYSLAQLRQRVKVATGAPDELRPVAVGRQE